MYDIEMTFDILEFIVSRFCMQEINFLKVMIDILTFTIKKLPEI